jgi:Flp pilus assembly protein TadG
MRAAPLKRQRGGDAVEFALTLPFMLLLLVIFVEYGLAFADKAVVVDASRAAARSAIGCNTATYSVSVCDQNARNAANAVLTSVIMWSGTSPYTCSSAKCPIVREPNPDVYNSVDQITATVTFTYQFRLLPNALFSRIVGSRGPLDLSGTTKMLMLPN